MTGARRTERGYRRGGTDVAQERDRTSVGGSGLRDVHRLDLNDPNRDALGNPVAANLTNSASVEERHPSWSPDDSKIVFNVPNALVRLDVATGATVVLTSQNGCGWAAWKRSVP